MIKDGPRNLRFNRSKGGPEKRTAAHVERVDYKNIGGAITLPKQQIEQLLKLLPQLSEQREESEDEYEDFAGNAFCPYVSIRTNAWIRDTGAIDHMSPIYKNFINTKNTTTKTSYKYARWQHGTYHLHR